MTDYKIDELKDSLNRLENFKPTRHPIEWCTARIDWLWKFRHITEEEMAELCDQAIRILDRR